MKSSSIRRPPAKSGRRRVIGPVIVVTGLVVLPGIAIARIAAEFISRPEIVAGAALLISIIAAISVRNDKRKAQAGEWRTQESILHLLELCGGWPGSYLAQRLCRHKTAKVSYQSVFWLIVLIYQGAAIAYLWNALGLHLPSPPFPPGN